MSGDASRGRLAVLSAGNFAVGTGALVISGVLPPVATDLDVDVATAGQLVTVYALVYAVAAPVLGGLTGAWSRRRLLLGALAVLAAGNVVVALAPSFGVLAAGRVLAAVGAALYTPTSLAIAAVLAPAEHRGRALAFVFAGLPVSTVLGVPLGTFVADLAGWRAAFWLVVGLAVAAAAAVALAVPRAAAPGAPGWAVWRSLLTSGPVLAGVAVTWLQATATFAAFTYIAALLGERGGFDGRAISLLLLLSGIAGVAGTALGGRLGDRFPAVPVLAGLLVVTAVSLAVLPPLAATAAGAVVGLSVWNVAAWAFNPVQQGRLLALTGGAPGPVLALNSSALYLGTAAGAVAGALAVRASGVASVGWVGALLAAAALLPLGASVALARRQATIAPAAATT